MQRRFTQREKAAVKAYYAHRKLRFGQRSKAKCLLNISQAVRSSRKLKWFNACAGTFWFRWKDGTTTVHTEHTWWRMKKGWLWYPYNWDGRTVNPWALLSGMKKAGCKR